MTPRLRFAPVLLLLALAAPARADELADQINAVLDGPDYRHARWGVLVVEAESGKVGYERLADVRDLARQVKKSSGSAVAGDVLVDDRLFPRGRATGSGPDSITPVVVNDNCLDLILSPGPKVGDPAVVKVRPATELYKIEVE